MFIQFQQDWSQLLGGCNWYTFRFADIQFEWDKILGGVEATIVLLGLGFRWRWNFTETELTESLAKTIEDIENGTADLTEIKRSGNKSA